MYLLLQLPPTEGDKQMFASEPRVACVVQPQALLELRALDGGISPGIAQPTPLSEMVMGKGDLLTVLFNLDFVIGVAQDCVEHIVPDLFAGLGTTQHLQPWPDPHWLGCAELPWGRLSFDQQSLIGLVVDVQLPIQLHPLFMGNA